MREDITMLPYISKEHLDTLLLENNVSPEELAKLARLTTADIRGVQYYAIEQVVDVLRDGSLKMVVSELRAKVQQVFGDKEMPAFHVLFEEGKIIGLSENSSPISLFDILNEGVMPNYPELKHEHFPNSKVGDVVAEGNVDIVLAGLFSRLGCDCAYLKAIDGNYYFDAQIFWGKRGYVQLVKTEKGFEVRTVGYMQKGQPGEA